mmetsp:Transcript_19431/g.41544  ORF Transcript_19431/g.41544 Transcript_19431/m.41544 type:complete len:223 (+) Transcript_19431:51-719(+)
MQGRMKQLCIFACLWYLSWLCRRVAKIVLNPRLPSGISLPVPTPQNPARNHQIWHETTSPDCLSCYKQTQGCPRCPSLSPLSMPPRFLPLLGRPRPPSPREESTESYATGVRGQRYAMADPPRRAPDRSGEDPRPRRREEILPLSRSFSSCFCFRLVCHVSSSASTFLPLRRRRFHRRLASSLLSAFWGRPSASFAVSWLVEFFLHGHWIGRRRPRGSEHYI